MKLIIPIFLNLMVIDYIVGKGSPINWTTKMRRSVLSMYYKTYPVDSAHKERMKEKWDRTYSHYENAISAEELHRYAINLIDNISHYHDVDDPFPWTPELNKKVLEIFYQTRAHQKFFEEKMKKSWNKVFLDLNADVHKLNLQMHALKLLGALSELEEGGRKKFVWPSGMNEDVLKMYHEIPRKETRRVDKIKELFNSRFPQYEHKISAEALYRHAHYLAYSKAKDEKTKPSKQRTPWTNKMYAEILHIYHQTNPDHRLHEKKMQYCWAKMHPELRDSTPTRLRRTAQSLIANKYKLRRESVEQAKIKFDEVFPDGFNYKGKEIMEDAGQTSGYQSESGSHHFHRDHSEPVMMFDHFHLDDPIHSPEHHQEFFDFDTEHQMTGSSQLPEHVPYTEDYPSHYEHGSSSQSHVQHYRESHLDDPIHSPVRHQEFLNEFDKDHQLVGSSQLPEHVPYTGDYPAYHDQYGSSSQSHVQHNRESHLDDPIYSPVRPQEFSNVFDIQNQLPDSSQLPEHDPNIKDHGSFSDKHGSSSRSQDQHHPD